MSFHLITITQLMQLDRPTLEYALRMFQKELEGTMAFLSETPAAVKDEATINDLGHLLTLRKVFKLRLEEMAEEDAAQGEGVRELATAA
ncbi:MAG: hypothetical protein ACRYF0_17525 [Janthinobacterium lividum]